MANTIDWDAAEEAMGGDFKPYANEGIHKVKCNDIEIKEVGENGSVVMKFKFEETEVAYPSADHWLSFKNNNWRYIHNKRLMMVLGASEEAAKKAVEMAESKPDKANVIKAYEACYKKLLAKKPEVEIEVYTDGKYSRAEFTDKRVAMPRDDKPKQIIAATVPIDDPLAGAEEMTSEDDLSSLPF